jgi:undecaprenyl-diphosphatase
MTIIQALLLGIVQGLTEFIPVSSTAHLLIAQSLLGIPASNAVFSFLVIVQLGTIVSLIIYFWKDIVQLVRLTIASIRPILDGKAKEIEAESLLGWYILIATLPALVAGYLLRNAVEALFKLPLLEAGIRLLITAVIMALAEGLGKRHHSLRKMTWLKALAIGAAQVLAVFPGASRSGTTISAGMLCRFTRPSAARFAFLMSIPVMLAAGGYQMLDVLKMPDVGSFLPVLAVGFVTAAAVGWLAIKWLMRFLKRHSLYIFIWYCAILGLAVLLIYAL